MYRPNGDNDQQDLQPLTGKRTLSSLPPKVPRPIASPGKVLKSKPGHNLSGSIRSSSLPTQAPLPISSPGRILKSNSRHNLCGSSSSSSLPQKVPLPIPSPSKILKSKARHNLSGSSSSLSSSPKVPFPTPSPKKNPKLKAYQYPSGSSSSLSSPPKVRLPNPPSRKIPKSHSRHNLSNSNSIRTIFSIVIPKANKLPIPFHLAAEHFHTLLPPSDLSRYPQGTLYLNFEWEMKFTYFADEEIYLITQGWDKYADWYNLRPGDTISFFKETSSSKNNHFLTNHRKRLERNHLPNYISFPSEFLYFTTIELSSADVGFGRLIMKNVEMPFQIRKGENVKVMDVKNKEWYMVVVYMEHSKDYMIIDGWEKFVREHKLEARDVVQFYRPTFPEHEKHFLIECAKTKRVEKKEEEVGESKAECIGCCGGLWRKLFAP